MTTKTPEQAAEEFDLTPYSREGLTSYFAQADLDGDGRVEWDIDMLAALMLNAQFIGNKIGRTHFIEHELLGLLEMAREGIGTESLYNDYTYSFDQIIAKARGER